MSQLVSNSFDRGQPVASFPTDLPTLRATSVEWIGTAAQSLAGRTELIKKVTHATFTFHTKLTLARHGVLSQPVTGTSRMSSSQASG